MKRELHFNYRDIPLCSSYGFSARKIWVFFKTLVIAWIMWIVFVYLGFLAAGEDMSTAWERGRLLPLPGGIFWESWFASVLMGIGLLLILYVIQAACLKVSRITFEQIRGDDFYSGKDASGFLSENYKPLVATPIAIITGILLVLLGGWILGLVGNIPAAGPVIIAVLTVPAYGFALLVILAILALIAGFRLVPAIVGTTHGDTFEALFELFSSITSQPWRLVFYWMLHLVVKIITVAVFLVLTSLALGIFCWTVSIPMGAGLGNTLVTAPQYFAPEVFGTFSSIIDPLGLTLSETAIAWTGIAGLLARLSGISIFLIIISFAMSITGSAWTIIYLIIRHRKDGENLLQRADDEEFRKFEEEYGSADESKRTEEQKETEKDE